MALTDPFQFQHHGRTREVDIQTMRIDTPTDGEPLCRLKARTHIVSGDPHDGTPKELQGADFDQAAFVAALGAEAAARGLSATGAQIAAVVVAAGPRMVRNRFAD